MVGKAWVAAGRKLYFRSSKDQDGDPVPIADHGQADRAGYGQVGHPDRLSILLMLAALDPRGRLEADHAGAVVVPGYYKGLAPGDIDGTDMPGLTGDRQSVEGAHRE